MESNRKDTHAILLLVSLTVGLLIVFTARITAASGPLTGHSGKG